MTHDPHDWACRSFMIPPRPWAAWGWVSWVPCHSSWLWAAPGTKSCLLSVCKRKRKDGGGGGGAGCSTKALSIPWPPLASLNRSWTWVTRASLSLCMKGKPDQKDLFTRIRCLSYQGELRRRERWLGGHLLLLVWTRPWRLKRHLAAPSILQPRLICSSQNPTRRALVSPFQRWTDRTEAVSYLFGLW